jgi:hypothetical protein
MKEPITVLNKEKKNFTDVFTTELLCDGDPDELLESRFPIFDARETLVTQRNHA